jgi:hypothetical protein
MGSGTVIAYADTVVDEVSIGAFRHGRGHPNSRPLHSDADIHVDLIADSQPNSGQWERGMRHLLRALFVLLLFLPALAFGQTFDFPASPTLNQQVTGPNGAIYKWDGTKWVAVGGAGGGFTAAGDLSGTSTSQSVIGIRSTAVPALGSGYLHYNGTAFVWDTPAAGTGTVTSVGLSGGTTGLTVSGSPITTSGTITLAGVLAIANGGNGASTAPTTGQIEVAQSASAYGPVTMSQDCTIVAAGTITCTKTNNVAFTALATAAIPLSLANGGTAATTAATARTSLGAAPTASPTFTGTVTMPDNSTWVSGVGGLIIKNDPAYAAIFFNGTTTQPQGTIQMQGASGIFLTAEMHQNSSGSWIADAANSAALNVSTAGISLDMPTGSTVGGAITHNYMMNWSFTTNSLTFPHITSGAAGTGGGTGGGAACITSGQVLISNAANCIASSLAFKTDIRPLDGALATIEKLAPAAIYYHYKQGFGGDRSEQPGFGAETVAQIDPRYALYANGKPVGVRYEQMAATEAAAIAEQQKEIEELKAEVKQLRGW